MGMIASKPSTVVTVPLRDNHWIIRRRFAHGGRGRLALPRRNLSSVILPG